MDMYLFEDHLRNGQTARFGDTVARAIYVTGGSISVGDKTYAYNDGLVVTGAVTVTAGDEGASLWRWDLSDAAPVDAPAHNALKLSGPGPEHLEVAGNFMRLDSVTFPPSGTAMLHTHQGPGIRCLREGSIRIDTEGHSTAFGPGGAWFEAGP